MSPKNIEKILKILMNSKPESLKKYAAMSFRSWKVISIL